MRVCFCYALKFMKKLILVLVFIVMVYTENLQTYNYQASKRQACYTFQDWADQMFKNFNLQFWLVFFGGCIMIAIHLIGIYMCLKKRHAKNKIKQEMKLKQIMYTETLIAYGAPRSRSNLKNKTIHV